MAWKTLFEVAKDKVNHHLFIVLFRLSPSLAQLTFVGTRWSSTTGNNWKTQVPWNATIVEKLETLWSSALPSPLRTYWEVGNRARHAECSLGLHWAQAQPPQSADFSPLGESQVVAELEDASQAKNHPDHTPPQEQSAQSLPAPATEKGKSWV